MQSLSDPARCLQCDHRPHLAGMLDDQRQHLPRSWHQAVLRNGHVNTTVTAPGLPLPAAPAPAVPGLSEAAGAAVHARGSSSVHPLLAQLCGRDDAGWTKEALFPGQCHYRCLPPVRSPIRPRFPTAGSRPALGCQLGGFTTRLATVITAVWTDAARCISNVSQRRFYN